MYNLHRYLLLHNFIEDFKFFWAKLKHSFKNFKFSVCQVTLFGCELCVYVSSCMLVHRWSLVQASLLSQGYSNTSRILYITGPVMSVKASAVTSILCYSQRKLVR